MLIFDYFHSSPNNTIEKNIIVFIDDDIGQLNQRIQHIYI